MKLFLFLILTLSGSNATARVVNQPLPTTGSDGLTNTQLRASAVPISGTVTCSGVGGGDATAANQVTGNSTLSTISGKLPALGQALAASSTPVVLTAAQLTALTPLSTVTCDVGSGTQAVSLATAPTTPVTGTFWQATQPVSGTFYQATQPVSLASAPTTPVTGTFWQATQPVSIATAPALVASSAVIGHVIVDTAPTTAVTESGTWTVQPGNTANTTAWKVDGSAVTQPVSGTFYQVTQPVSLASAPTTPVTGTFWQVTQPVSGTFWQSTQPVSIATAPALVASSAVIGHVIVDTAPSTAVTGPLTDTQIRATALPVSGTVSANATLSAETTKVIGTVNVAASQTIATTNTGTFAVQAAATIADGANTTLGAKADAKSTATDTTAITAMSVLKQISASVQAPPSQAVTNAGTFAVQAAVTEADAANVTLGAKADAKNTATDTTSVTVMSVLKQISASVQAPPSQAVTNAGTFAVQATITGSNPCNYPGATLVSITGATSTNNATQIVALSGSTKIYICSLTVIGVSGTTPAFGLVSGTGSNCASSQTTVLQAFTTTAGQLYAFANPVAVTTAAHALCYKDTGTSPIENYAMTYVQQ